MGNWHYVTRFRWDQTVAAAAGTETYLTRPAGSEKGRCSAAGNAADSVSCGDVVTRVPNDLQSMRRRRGRLVQNTVRKWRANATENGTTLYARAMDGEAAIRFAAGREKKMCVGKRKR